MSKGAAYMVVDYIVFFIFIIGSSIFPLWGKTRNPKTKANYVFATYGSISMGAMMLSIARGTLGVRSFLGFPSELFYKGSAMWETLYGMIFAYPLVSFIFVPVYYSLGITSVYQYLDLRFKSRLVRCLASATYILRQVLNMAVTVFTPCIALNTVIGLPYWVSILGITLISVIFAVFGGLGAAIKADVIQGITMILISIAIIIQCCYEAGGPANVVKIPLEDGRLKFFDFKWDINVRVDTMSAWIGQLFMSLSLYGCQQNFVQRYCSMSSEKKVRQTLLANIPIIIILFSLSWIVGMGIYSIYSTCDPLSSGYIKKIDEILPFFIEDKFSYMPGLMGLFMGSLFNGALTLSVSNLNSLATVTWEDFLSHAPAFKNLKDKKQLTIIKLLGVFYGIVIMGISFCVGLFSGIVESNMLMTSATSGALLGVFVLAMLVPCATRKGAAAGMIISHLFVGWITFGHLMTDLIPVKELPTSIAGCTNETFAAHIVKPGQQWLLPSTPLEVNINTTSFLQHLDHPNTTKAINIKTISDINPFKPLYMMTYMYYALVGTMVTVIIGILVSLIFKIEEDDIYDEKLLHPLILKLSRMLPGKPRRYLKQERSSIHQITSLSINKNDMDNLGYEAENEYKVQTLNDKNNSLCNNNKTDHVEKGVEVISMDDVNYVGNNESFRSLSEEELHGKQITKF